jgi:hypothetical protein
VFVNGKLAERPGDQSPSDGEPSPEAVGRVATILFCLWLAWSRFRVVVPLLDKTAPSVWAAADVALRRIGGVPTYLLTGNEKTVTVEHGPGSRSVTRPRWSSGGTTG